MTRWLILVAVSLVVALHLLLDVLLALLFRVADRELSHPSGEFVLLAIAGVYFGQGNLIATWAAFAPGRLLVRIPWTTLLAVLMWYGLLLGTRCGEWSTNGPYNTIDRSTALFFGLLIMTGVFVAQTPLWIASRAFAWRLRPPHDPLGVEVDERQFNITHLLGGMLAVSIALALGRLVMPAEGDWSPFFGQMQLYVVLAIAILGNLIIAAPCIWLSFISRSLILPLALGWLVLVLIASALEFGVLLAFNGPPGDEYVRVWLEIVVFNLMQCVCIVLTLAVLRAIGFRLSRARDRKTAGSDESKSLV